MPTNTIVVFCPDTSTDGRTKVLHGLLPTSRVRTDTQGSTWELLGTQGALTWWKLRRKHSGAILHDDVWLGYEMSNAGLHHAT
jgi:hypothetical protein